MVSDFNIECKKCRSIDCEIITNFIYDYVEMRNLYIKNVLEKI